ncbi:MAG: hypothetical protein V7709_03815 [Halioglobus sp.]
MSSHYPHLMSPGKIAAMELRNRIVLAAMGSNFASEDGYCTERLNAYYEARVKGGAQLNHGGKMAQEDTAAGRPIPIPSPLEKGTSDMFNVLAPAEIGSFIKAAGPDGLGPRFYEMTEADIRQTTEQFAVAALRAQKAGSDAIEIHAGHGYLIATFLCPAAWKQPAYSHSKGIR